MFAPFQLCCGLLVYWWSLLLASCQRGWGFTDSVPRIPQLVKPLASPYCPVRNPARTTERFMALSEREKEIRRLIAKLKEQGKLKPTRGNEEEELDDDDDANSLVTGIDYASKIQAKLGRRKSRMLGYGSVELDETTPDDELDAEQLGRIGRIAAAGRSVQSTAGSARPAPVRPLIDPSLFREEDSSETELSDEDLAQLVSEKMSEMRQREQSIEAERMRQDSLVGMAERGDGSPPLVQITTSSVGGKWIKNETAANDLYKPKTGSWGAFPRPRDVSEAFGGGRRVGAGYLNEQAKAESAEATRERLRQYRERVGIEVQSEKEHAADIDEALSIAAYAMQRGMYSTAVSALEKVTRYCSSNSKVGGKVFLELAMAYEAVGRSDEASTVYTTLSNSRIEEIRFNAKQLLYGLEAIQFMQNNVGNPAFSRKRASSVFIDTTGLANFAQNFDNVYNTAYIDLERGFYQRLTESVVRSSREARQILLRATCAGEVERLRIVQALRSLSRKFDEALQAEISRNAPAAEPVAVLDGKPIVGKRLAAASDDVTALMGADGFVLADPQQMVDNIHGEWRLQLLADKSGDGVTFFNSTLSWQCFNTGSMSFSSQCLSGFATVQLSGDVVFNAKRRILRRNSVVVSGGVLSGLFGADRTGAAAAVRLPQQVITVDSVLLVTRGVPSRQGGPLKKSYGGADKDYFAVWRRVDPGTYSSSRNQR